ncbi:exportin [Acrasis kona]|uniref:Exportin n=1 Tax=Acrasis kona TaxID=1008807 RepID=A0AAW2ZB02_9EUKA
MNTSQDIAQLANVLQCVAHPDNQTRKRAEEEIERISAADGFSLLLMRIIVEPNLANDVKLSATLILKNYVKKRWDDNMNDSDRSTMKANIINVMVATTSVTVQKQLSELILIMSNNFSNEWQTLLPSINQKLKETTDFGVIRSLLFTTHSIFKKYRNQEETDEVTSELVYIMKSFAPDMFEITSKLIEFYKANGQNEVMIKAAFENILFIVKIFYSLNWVTLPEFFEDRMETYFTWFHELLLYSNNYLESDDESISGVLDKVKAQILSIVNLYLEKYDEEFTKPMVETFKNDCWELLTRTGPELKYDSLVAKGITLLTTISKSGHNQLFANQDVLKEICERIVIPNLTLRDEDEEIFECDCVEYIRRDLEGSDTDTRRRASIELVKGLCMYHEASTTSILLQKVTQMLQQPNLSVKNKDLCIYLVISISVKAKTEKKGATQVNHAVNVMEFLQTQIIPELTKTSQNSQIIQADAIKYICVFRQLLNADAFPTLFPLLINLLLSTSRVVHTYAAWCIDKWLNTKDENKTNRFNKQHVKPYAELLFRNLFASLKNGSENEYMIKAMNRVTGILREEMQPVLSAYIELLTQILLTVAKNPSNPQFNHYIFENFATAIKYNPNDRPNFERALMPIFYKILQDDVPEFTPYVYQLLSQLLELDNSGNISVEYVNLLPRLVRPGSWSNEANIPGLTSLLVTLIQKSPNVVSSNESLQKVLGVFQSLLGSKQNDQYGLRLLDAIINHVPTYVVAPYLNTIFNLLFRRLSNKRTAKFEKLFVIFISLIAIKHGASSLVNVIQAVDAALFDRMVMVFLVTNMKKINGKIERKSVGVACVKLLFEAHELLDESRRSVWNAILKELVEFLLAPQVVDAAADESVGGSAFMPSGYKVNFTKLSSAAKPAEDPCADVVDPVAYFVSQLGGFVNSSPAAKALVKNRIMELNIQGKVGELFNSKGLGQAYQDMFQ